MKIKLLLENNYSRVEPLPSQDTYQEMSHAMSFLIKGYEMTEAFQRGVWDGRKRLIDKGRFPTGLSGIARTVLKANGYTVEVEDLRIDESKSIEVKWKFPHAFRDYQQKAFDAFQKAQRGCIVLPTASGKTILAAYAISQVKKKVLYLVQTKEALRSTLQDFDESLDADIGEKMSNDIVVTTVHSLSNPKSKKLKELNPKAFGFLILDEVHHYGADTFYDAVFKIEALYRLGITATLKRADGATILLQAATGKVLFQATPKELIDQGYLAKPTIHWISYPFPKISPYADSRSAYRKGIVECDTRNKEIVKIAESLQKAGKSFLIVVEAIEHGELLSFLLNRKGIVAPFVHGKVKGREDIQAEFKSGKTRQLIATRIYDESVNLPHLNAVIQAAGGASATRSLQRIGRALRRPDGTKQTADFFDFVDESHRVLEDHYQSRRQALEKAYS